MKLLPENWSVRIQFKPSDMWIGLYRKTRKSRIIDGDIELSLLTVNQYFICLIPCFPIILTKRHEQITAGA